MHIQLLHTSASLAINENWDPDVRDDMEMMLNRIVPEDVPFRHSCEGPDDMVSCTHPIKWTLLRQNICMDGANCCEWGVILKLCSKGKMSLSSLKVVSGAGGALKKVMKIKLSFSIIT